MGTLLLKAAGPLQSWGADSRYSIRGTRHEPTKSGVVGILAAALGRGRDEAVDDLAALPMAVRVDQPGYYLEDFQTARKRKYDKERGRWVACDSLPLSRRHYLADAVFVIAVEVPDEELGGFAEALDHPAYPLYLGRRACPPSGRLLIDALPGVLLMEALASVPWAATDPKLLWANRERREVSRPVVRDAMPGDGEELARESVRDVPVSFSRERRQYGLRDVVRVSVTVANPHGIAPDHDPMAALEA